MTARTGIGYLQSLMRNHFGDKTSSGCGERTISIGPDKVELTDEYGTIIARGPAKVATVLVRKKRNKNK